MVITLVPGIFNDSASARRHPRHHSPGRRTRQIPKARPLRFHLKTCQQIAAQMLQRQRLPDFVLPYMMQRVGQERHGVQQAVVLHGSQTAWACRLLTPGWPNSFIPECMAR